MNLTVGPLPPAVYWRRRAVVAGVLLVLVLLVAYACGGSSSSGAGQPAANSAANTDTPDPAGSELRPETGSPPVSDQVSEVPTAPSTAPAPAAPASDFCADTEIQLTPAVQKISGGSFAYQLTLRVKNVSSRTCKRDVGADPQELHVIQNGQTIWSSDACQKVHGQPDVRTFPPGIEDAFMIGWDGTAGTGCTNKQPAPAGTYQIVAKLNTKVSAPVTFSVG
jgi:hypothetical protein